MASEPLLWKRKGAELIQASPLFLSSWPNFMTCFLQGVSSGTGHCGRQDNQGISFWRIYYTTSFSSFLPRSFHEPLPAFPCISIGARVLHYRAICRRMTMWNNSKWIMTLTPFTHPNHE